jgi:glycosyltransferase involved in cell wall biosynthesis
VKIATLGNAAVVHTQRWVEHFRARGHEVALWSLEEGPPRLEARPLPAPPIPRFLRYPLATPALRRALAAFDPDLVDAHFVPNYGLLGALAGRHPLAVTAWGSDLLLPRGGLQRARAHWVLARADLVIADAENLAAAARALGAAPERVACIPWGVPLDLYREGSAREPGLILSTRRMETLYDLPTVIEAAARVMAERPETRLALAGDGPARASLERLAATRLARDRVQFLGALDAAGVASWLARAEVYVSASRSDSTSLSLLEAMAAGAVPVLSDIEGNREWVRDGEGARLFAPGDAESLARALEQVLDDAQWRARARLHNRHVVEGRADHARNMARIEERFEALARGRR